MFSFIFVFKVIKSFSFQAMRSNYFRSTGNSQGPFPYRMEILSKKPGGKEG